jgi:hypothetical protein
MSGKNRSVARQAVKNKRRLKRHGSKRWLKGKPVLKDGMGGTDKSGTVKPSKVYYSQASAEINRGKPNHWSGITYRPK